MVPLNLRPPAFRREVFANLSLSATLSTRPHDRASPAALMRCVVAQTRAMKDDMAAATMIDVLRPMAAVPVLWKRSLPGFTAQMTHAGLWPTTVLSNLGRVEEPLSFGSEGPACEVWISPPSPMPMGEIHPADASANEVWISPPSPMPMGLGIGVVSHGGAIYCSFRCRHPLLSAEAARRFADTLFNSIELLV
jgi:hypothetical protein